MDYYNTYKYLVTDRIAAKKDKLNLYYGGHLITMEQICIIEHVFYRYYVNPFNCFHRHLPQLEIIHDCLTRFHHLNPFDITPKKIIAEQLYKIIRDLDYELVIFIRLSLEKTFGNYEDHINSEEAIFIDFVNKMTHLLTCREHNVDKVIMLLECCISQIKENNKIHKLSIGHNTPSIYRKFNKKN